MYVICTVYIYIIYIYPYPGTVAICREFPVTFRCWQSQDSHDAPDTVHGVHGDTDAIAKEPGSVSKHAAICGNFWQLQLGNRQKLVLYLQTLWEII